jgi:hypothetical protein
MVIHAHVSSCIHASPKMTVTRACFPVDNKNYSHEEDLMTGVSAFLGQNLELQQAREAAATAKDALASSEGEREQEVRVCVDLDIPHRIYIYIYIYIYICIYIDEC